MGKLRFATAITGITLLLGLGFVSRAVSTGVDLSTHRGVQTYLKSHGWDPGQFVIQRGLRNYAGPHCPGVGWSCTTSLKVVQVASVANVSECPKGDTCNITQGSATGTTDNAFVCEQNDSGPQTSSAATQSCVITQLNGSGNNRVRIGQIVNQAGGTGQIASQTADVTQTTDSGANVADVQQIVHQGIRDDAAAQSQATTQMATFHQTSNSGANQITLSQNLKQDEKTHLDGGSQQQAGTHSGSIHQISGGLSTFAVNQDARQKMDGMPGTAQNQDPNEFCCANQFGNPNDTGTINQVSVQEQMPSQNQSALLEADCITTGNCTANQSATANGNMATNSATGSEIFISVSCSSEGCFQGGGGDFTGGGLG